MAQKFLHRSDIVVGFQEVGRKAMAQGVGADWFHDAGQTGRLFDRLL